MIYFLRHVKTQNNRFNIISGQSETRVISVPRSSNNLIHNNFDLVYSSPSKRCVYTLEKNRMYMRKVLFDRRLYERNMGRFEGQFKNRILSDYPDCFIEYNGKACFDVLQTPPNGESFEDFYSRVNDFVIQCLVNNMNKNILICSHNQTLKMLYFILSGLRIDTYQWAKLDFPNNRIVSFDMIYSANNKAKRIYY